MASHTSDSDFAGVELATTTVTPKLTRQHGRLSDGRVGLLWNHDQAMTRSDSGRTKSRNVCTEPYLEPSPQLD